MVKRLTGKPSGITAPSGIVYRYFAIIGSGPSVSKVKVDFIVEKAWITANNIDKNKLKVWRAGDTSFTGVPTTIVDEDATSVIVRGEASGFSYWAVTGEKACTGNILLDLPESAEGGESVTATVSGLSNCAGKIVHIRPGSCSGEDVCTITVDGGGGSCGFDAPNATDIYTYYACIDKDGDGSYAGAGESDSATLEVTVAAAEEEEEVPVCGNGICEAGENSENCPQDCPPVPEGPPEITSEDALAAINRATSAISDARKEGKDVSSAFALLQEAVAAYNVGDYAEAKDKADKAVLEALAAEPRAAPVELPITYMALVALVIGAAGIGIYLFKKKGLFKKRGGAKPVTETQVQKGGKV